MTGLILAAIVVFGAASPANAYTPSVNGCGAANGLSRYLIPNNPLGYPFKPACDQHDFCYGAGNDKSFCDAQIDQTLKTTCDGRWLCQILGKVYYGAVHFVGASAYAEARTERVDTYLSDLRTCGMDAACVVDVSNGFELDSLMNKLQACQGDRACEHNVADRYGSTPTPQTPDATLAGDIDSSGFPLASEPPC